MNVHELIADAERHVPENAPFGVRHRAQGIITTGDTPHHITVAARIDAQGHRRDQYFCDGTRVPRHVLLRLTCAETECPQAQAVREQWTRFQRRGTASPQRHSGPPHVRPLMSEVEVAAAGHRCVARPARFNCFGPCPNQAHPPMWIEKTGFDLFEDGACVGGGILSAGGTSRPRLPSIEAAQAYLLARRLEALAALDAAVTRTRSSGSA